MTVSVGAEGQSHLYASYAEDMRFPCGHNTALLGIQAYGMPGRLLYYSQHGSIAFWEVLVSEKNKNDKD